MNPFVERKRIFLNEIFYVKYMYYKILVQKMTIIFYV